jgi:hypothetical protein
MRSKSRFTTLVLLETREIRSVCNRSLREDTTVPPWGAQRPVGVLCHERCPSTRQCATVRRMRLRQPPLGPRDAASQIARVQLCSFQMLPHTAVSDTRHVDRARLHPPGPCDPTSKFCWMSTVVRQLRRMGIAIQSCSTEYPAAVAAQLLRRCQWDDGPAADRFRRTKGYAVAARLARALSDESSRRWWQGK